MFKKRTNWFAFLFLETLLYENKPILSFFIS